MDYPTSMYLGRLTSLLYQVAHKQSHSLNWRWCISVTLTKPYLPVLQSSTLKGASHVESNHGNSPTLCMNTLKVTRPSPCSTSGSFELSPGIKARDWEPGTESQGLRARDWETWLFSPDFPQPKWDVVCHHALGHVASFQVYELTWSPWLLWMLSWWQPRLDPRLHSVQG